jgi:hypothetical protein
MSKKEMPGTLHVPKPKKVRRPFWVWVGDLIDVSVYWVALAGLAVLAVSGLKFYLQPIDPILSSVFSVSLVACIFYIAIRNR